MSSTPQEPIAARTRAGLLRAVMLLAAWGGILTPGPALADFLLPHTGHTVFGGNGAGGLGSAGGDGHVSFAVYENNSGNWITALGLSDTIAKPLIPGTSVASDAWYIYFYQIVNTDPISSGLDPALTALTLSGAGNFATSVGYLAGYGFNDVGTPGGSSAGSAPVNSGNVNLGVNTLDPDVRDDGTPSASDFAFKDSASAFVELDGAQAPDSYLKEFGDLRFSFQDLTGVGNLGDYRIAYGESSAVVFFTSHSPPAYRFSILEDSADTQADVPVPVPIPEPASLWVMLVAGLPWAAISGRSRLSRLRRIGKA